MLFKFVVFGFAHQLVMVSCIYVLISVCIGISCYKCIVTYNCFCRQCDRSIWSVEARLQLPKVWKDKILPYKYYVVTGKQPSGDNYEHIVHSGGGIHNRCLVPYNNVYYDARGNSSLIK